MDIRIKINCLIANRKLDLEEKKRSLKLLGRDTEAPVSSYWVTKAEVLMLSEFIKSLERLVK
jgi:hypothetical protein